MKGDPKVIAYLNDGLKKEMTAINQYFLHSRMLEDWGVTKLARYEYEESIEEMQHADKFIQRILFLGGRPDMQNMDKLLIGGDVKEVLENNLKLEIDGIDAYKEAIAYCASVKDYVSRSLFMEVLKDEEGHVDYLETQLHMIENMGIQNYILLNSESPLDLEKAESDEDQE